MDIKALKAFPMLKGISDSDLEAFITYTKEETFEKGKNIITEGDDGNIMYFLIEGKVDIIKKTMFGDDFVCASLTDQMHCVFGEMAMIDKDKRSATVKATTVCKTLSIDNKNFEEFCEKYNKAAISLLKLMNVNLIRNLRIENENLKIVYQALIEEIEGR